MAIYYQRRLSLREEQKVHRRDGHILSVNVIPWVNKKGLAFFEKPGCGITHRVVFPAEL